MERKGTLYFFTGLAGAGKSTIGRLFYQKLKAQRNDILLFDGDVGRAISQDADYSNEARLQSCRRGMGVYKQITDQGVDVVCCIIGMFEEVRAWYRANIENYRVIYVKASMETLYRRDQKGLYTSGAKQVVGVDLPWEEPQDPDVLIENDGAETPEEIVDRLLLTFGLTEDKHGVQPYDRPARK